MCYKFQFIEQNKTTPTDLNICRGFNILIRITPSQVLYSWAYNKNATY